MTWFQTYTRWVTRRNWKGSENSRKTNFWWYGNLCAILWSGVSPVEQVELTIWGLSLWNWCGPFTPVMLWTMVKFFGMTSCSTFQGSSKRQSNWAHLYSFLVVLCLGFTQGCQNQHGKWYNLICYPYYMNRYTPSKDQTIFGPFRRLPRYFPRVDWTHNS